jgi:hypothetical protein
MLGISFRFQSAEGRFSIPKVLLLETAIFARAVVWKYGLRFPAVQRILFFYKYERIMGSIQLRGVFRKEHNTDI